MSSERSKLEVNVNDSKNTRMNISSAFSNFAIRKDELMHVGRYFRAISEIQTLVKELGRPIRILELGCGECYVLQLFYHAIIETKSDFVKSYIGVDIDEPMLEKTRIGRKSMLDTMHAKLISQDLTTNPTMRVKDNYFDLVICFETFEHIQAKFVAPILGEINRVLNENGTALLSTPNSAGSSSKLPKDHVYEWDYIELCEEIQNNLVLESSHGVGVNVSKIPKSEKKRLAEIAECLNNSFGTNTYFSSTVLGAFCEPDYCKNVLYVCKKLDNIPF